jgi:hypothetical protein
MSEPKNIKCECGKDIFIITSIQDCYPSGYLLKCNSCGEVIKMRIIFPRPPYSYNMNEVEAERANKWKEEHRKTCKIDIFSYIFEPTGIGVGIDVKCKCGAKIDVTDIDSW